MSYWIITFHMSIIQYQRFQVHLFSKKISSKSNNLIQIIYLRIEVCFYLLKVQSYQFLTYQETYNLLINNQNVKNIFQYYSVSKIEVIFFHNLIRNDFYYFLKRCYDNDPYTPWKFDSLSIGIMILACTTLFFTILGIILLITCWTSHMKHALITRNMEFTDSSSNSSKCSLCILNYYSSIYFYRYFSRLIFVK